MKKYKSRTVRLFGYVTTSFTEEGTLPFAASKGSENVNSNLKKAYLYNSALVKKHTSWLGNRESSATIKAFGLTTVPSTPIVNVDI